MFQGGSDEDEEQVLSVNNTLVMRGLIDVICIIWAGFRQELDKVVIISLHTGVKRESFNTINRTVKLVNLYLVKVSIFKKYAS